MEYLTSNHGENFLNNIMVGVKDTHGYSLGTKHNYKIQLLSLCAKLSINMAYVYQALSSDIAFNISHSRWGTKF